MHGLLSDGALTCFKGVNSNPFLQVTLLQIDDRNSLSLHYEVEIKEFYFDQNYLNQGSHQF